MFAADDSSEALPGLLLDDPDDPMLGSYATKILASVIATLSYYAVHVHLTFGLVFICDLSLASAVYPIGSLLYALVTAPHDAFWKALLVYTEALLLLQYVFQVALRARCLALQHDGLTAAHRFGLHDSAVRCLLYDCPALPIALQPGMQHAPSTAKGTMLCALLETGHIAIVLLSAAPLEPALPVLPGAAHAQLLPEHGVAPTGPASTRQPPRFSAGRDAAAPLGLCGVWHVLWSIGARSGAGTLPLCFLQRLLYCAALLTAARQGVMPRLVESHCRVEPLHKRCEAQMRWMGQDAPTIRSAATPCVSRVCTAQEMFPGVLEQESTQQRLTAALNGAFEALGQVDLVLKATENCEAEAQAAIWHAIACADDSVREALLLTEAEVAMLAASRAQGVDLGAVAPLSVTLYGVVAGVEKDSRSVLFEVRAAPLLQPQQTHSSYSVISLPQILLSATQGLSLLRCK